MSKPCKKFGHIGRYASGHCKECALIARRDHRRNNPRPARTNVVRELGPKEYAYQSRLRRVYGITKREYDAMFASQGNCCAICQGSDPGSKLGRWHIDHCHDTGNVRGILCAQCNIMIGMSKEDPVILLAGIRYLEEATTDASD